MLAGDFKALRPIQHFIQLWNYGFEHIICILLELNHKVLFFAPRTNDSARFDAYWLAADVNQGIANQRRQRTFSTLSIKHHEAGNKNQIIR